MAKSIPASGAGAVRIMLKNKDALQCELRQKNEEGTKVDYLYDVFYENVSGTFRIVLDNDQVTLATLNINMGKVINLDNDANLKKLALYVIGK